MRYIFPILGRLVPVSILFFGVFFVAPTPTYAWFGDYQYCQKWDMAAGGGSGGVATTTSNSFSLMATSTISTLAATSSGGRIEVLTSYTAASTTPVDIAITNGTSCTSAEGSLIPFYFQDYDKTTGAFAVTLEYSGISSTTQKSVLVYYGDPAGTDQSSANTTFGGLGELGVWGFGATDLVDNVTDRSGNSNSGTLGSGFTSTTTSTGIVGRALQYSATSNQQVDIPNTSFAPSNIRTVSMWIKRSSLTTNLPRLLAEYTDASNNFDILVPQTANSDENTLVASVLIGGVRSSIKAPNNTLNQTNRWYHVVAQWSTTPVVTAIYVDGVAQTLSSSLAAGPATTARLYIGNRTDGARPFNGHIDDVRIYNTLLHAMDVLTIYNNTSNSVAFWDFGSEEEQPVGGGGEEAGPRKLRLFEGFTVKFLNGKIILHQQ